MTAAPDPYLAGLRLLGRRDYTAAELRARLLARGCPEPDVAHALDRLRREGALDDARAARAYASTAARVKGRGRLRVLRELEARGVDPEVARGAVDEVFSDIDETALVERALTKRLHGPIASPAEARRLHQALTRLGFPPAAIAAALRRHSRRGAVDADRS